MSIDADANSVLNVCLPMKSFHEVLCWNKPTQPDWSQYVTAIKTRSNLCVKGFPVCGTNREWHFSSKRPKTLVCHDMRGGYLNDRFVNDHPCLDDFKFFSWPCIDVFVYFSHNLLTIPPLSWINAGHKHGVKVLGTIITEFEAGALAWKNILGDYEAIEKLATNMALICKHYGFDGYLLNIENKLETDSMGSFLEFMNILYFVLKSINGQYTLIWYDAVTVYGRLEWQNQLNFKNWKFLENCDGIFLNYDWGDEHLLRTAALAGARKFDVYVGIDVFGRGKCTGGFDSHKALNFIRQQDLSVAIFAPGWVHENCKEHENANDRNFQFWKSLSEYLYVKGPTELPFETSFCPGFGEKTFNNGLVIKDGPWFNQSKINHLPAIMSGIDGVNDDYCFEIYSNDGFSGGGSLLVRNKNKDDVDHLDCLLVCDFSTSRNKICIDIVTKPLCESDKCEMNLIILTANTSQNCSQSCEIGEFCERKHYFTIRNDEESKINSWFLSKFELELGDDHVLSIGCQLTGERKPVLVGNLKVYPSNGVPVQ